MFNTHKNKVGCGPRDAHCGPGPGRGFGSSGRRGMRGGRERGDGFASPGKPERRRGPFSGDELRLVLLKIIAETPRHGYDLIREIETQTGGAYAPSPGVVYPSLTMLQDMGLIVKAVADGSRKAYAVTPEGTELLVDKQAEVEALLGRITQIGTAQHHTGRSPVRRAVHNLHVALQDRVSRSQGDDDLMHQIAALLDEVAQKIERS